MATVDVRVTDLTFPANLKDAYCKFRPLISLSYRDSNNKINYAREALPGLGSRDYWECEKDNKSKPNYVRHATLPKVDMNKIGTSHRRIIFNDLDIKQLEAVEVEIFDVDIKSGFWDKFKDHVVQILPVAAAPFIPATLPLTLVAIKNAYEKGTGKKVADLEKKILSKAMGREDGATRSLWNHDRELTSDPAQTVTIEGGSGLGNFSITLKIEVM